MFGQDLVLNTCWKAALSCPCLRRFRIWVWSWWGSGVTWTGVTAPDLMARRTLSLILAPCSRTAMLTSSFTACLTYLTIVSSRLQASHTFHCFTSFQNIYLLLYQYTYLYVYSIILFALLNFLKFKVKVKFFTCPKHCQTLF